MDATERQKSQRGSPLAEDGNVYFGVVIGSLSSDGIANFMKGPCRFTVEDYGTGAPMPGTTGLQDAVNPEQFKKAARALSEMLHVVQPTVCERSFSGALASNTVSQSCSSSSISSGATAPCSADNNQPSSATSNFRSHCQAAKQDCQASRKIILFSSLMGGACPPRPIHDACQALLDMTAEDLAPAHAIPTIKQHLSDALLDPVVAAMAARQTQSACCCAPDIDSRSEVLVSAVDRDLVNSMKYIRCQVPADSCHAVESCCALIRSTIGTALTQLLQKHSVPADATALMYAACQMGRPVMAIVTMAYSTPQNQSSACCAARRNLTFWLAGVDRSDINISNIISNMPRDAASSPKIAALLKAVQAKNRPTDAAAVDRKVDMSATASSGGAVVGEAKGWGLSGVLSGFKGMFQRSNLNFNNEPTVEPAEASKTAVMDAVPPMTASDGAPDAVQPTAGRYQGSNSISSDISTSNRTNFPNTTSRKASEASFMNIDWGCLTKPPSKATTACCALVTAALGGCVSASTVHKVKQFLSDTQQDPVSIAAALAEARLPVFQGVSSSSIRTQQYLKAVDVDLVHRFDHIQSCLPAKAILDCNSGLPVIRDALAKALTEMLQEQTPAVPNISMVCQAACYVGRYALAAIILRAAEADQPKIFGLSLIHQYFTLCLLRLARPASYVDGTLPNVPQEILSSPHIAGLYELYQAEREALLAASVDNTADTMAKAAATTAAAADASVSAASASEGRLDLRIAASTGELSGRKMVQSSSSISSSSSSSSSKAQLFRFTACGSHAQAIVDKFCSPAVFLLPDDMEATEEELAALCEYRLHMQKAGTSWQQHSGWNALHYAVASHKVQLVQQLLAAGAEIEAPDPLLQLTPLHLACMGKIEDQQQLEELKQAAGTLYEFQSYCMHHGPANDAIVKTLLDKKADPSIQVASGRLALISPLHVLSSWSPVRLPIVGQHGSSSNRAVSHNSNSHDKREVDQQLSCLNALRLAGADLDQVKKPNGETFVTFAAHCGASYVISWLREHHDVAIAERLVNTPRLADGARPLELAVRFGNTTTALRLLEAGAKVVPDSCAALAVTAASTPKQPLKAELQPEMLLLNVIPSRADPDRATLLQKLLAAGGDIWLEEQYPETRQTALNVAVGVGNVECVRLLVAFGADTAAAAKPTMLPPLACAAITGRADIVQILLDAGADHSKWFDHKTGYDLVQTAATYKHLDVVIKLVEAGASWAHPNSRKGGTLLHVPDILKSRVPTTKVCIVERKLKLAEKTYKQRRAAAAAGQLIDAAPVCMAATRADAKRIGIDDASSSTAAAEVCAADVIPASTATTHHTAAAGLEDDLSACDIDALAAVIESAGSSAVAGKNASKKSKKKKKQQKCRGKVKQCDKQAVDTQQEGGGCEKAGRDQQQQEQCFFQHQQEQQQPDTEHQLASIDPVLAPDTAAAIRLATAGAVQDQTGSNDHCAGGVVEQTQLIVAEPRQQAASTQRSRQQQQLATEQPSVETIPAQAVMHEAAIPQHDSLSEHAAGTVIASIDEDDDAVQAGSSVSQPLLASEAAAPQAVPAPTVAPPCASLTKLVTTAASQRQSLPLPPPAAAAPTLVPVGLQQWRGSLNPIFMYNRSGSTSHRSISSAAGETAKIQPTAATTTTTAAAAAAPPTPSILAETWQQQQQQQQRQGVPPGPCSALKNALPLTAVRLTKAAVAEDTDTSVAALPGVTERECIVCLERPSNVLLLPCKHIVLCAVCADQLHARGSLKECPWCRNVCERHVGVPL